VYPAYDFMKMKKETHDVEHGVSKEDIEEKVNGNCPFCPIF
jgi:hypothetical protein